MPRKKILVDATGIVKTPTGLGKYSVYLLRSLLKNRNFQFSVFIQSNIAGNHPLRSLEKGNVHLISIDIPVIGPRREFVIYRMRESINNYHLYHCLSSYLPGFGIRIPSLVTIHDLKYLIFPQFLSNHLKAAYYSWIIRRSIRNATYIIAVSRATKQDVGRLGGSLEKIKVIHEAPTISYNGTSALPDTLLDKEFFLFVGENRPHKNISRIIAAYSKVERDLGNQCPLFVFVGSKYEALMKRYASEKLIFLEPVPDETLANLYKHAYALVYPSLYEGFGLPILEAMEIGAPVITSNCSAMPEVAGDAALLIDPYDTDQMAAAMISLVHDKGKRTQLINAGKRRVRQFSWDRTAHEIIELYEAVI